MLNAEVGHGGSVWKSQRTLGLKKVSCNILLPNPSSGGDPLRAALSLFFNGSGGVVRLSSYFFFSLAAFHLHLLVSR